MKFADILTFPDEIIIDLLVVWSNRFSVVKLDTACCNSSDRPHLLNILKHNLLVLKADSIFLYFNHNHSIVVRTNKRRLLLYWLSLRDIKVSEIILSSFSFQCDRTLIYNINLISLRRLAFCLFETDAKIDFLYIINKCVDLTELTFSRTVSSISDKLIEQLNCLEQLKLFSIDCFSSSSCSPLMLKFLSSRCRNLECFKFNFNSKACEFFCSTSIYADYLTKLFNHNQKISNICFYINEVPNDDFESLFGNIPVVDMLDVIIDNCPQIKYCKLKCIGKLNVLKVAILCNESKTLVYLHVIKCDYQLYRTITYRRFSSEKKSIFCSDFYYSNSVDRGEFNIEHLFKMVVGLDKIVVKHIWNLGDNLLFIIADNNWSALTDLTIETCLNATWSHRGIESVLLHCKILSKLTLSDCSHLTEDDFNQMARVTTSNLKTLIIYKATNISTNSVVLLMDTKTNLADLHIKNWFNLSFVEIHKYRRANKPELKLHL
jgi:hypothetical protein